MFSVPPRDFSVSLPDSSSSNQFIVKTRFKFSILESIMK